MSESVESIGSGSGIGSSSSSSGVLWTVLWYVSAPVVWSVSFVFSLEWIFLFLISSVVAYFCLYHWSKPLTTRYKPEDQEVKLLSEEEVPVLPQWLKAMFPFQRIHYVDEGPKDAPHQVVMLHGNPTWSFLWRKVIAQVLSKNNVRVIVPDLIGCGLSEKLEDMELLGNLEFHIDMMDKFMKVLQLEDITLVAQDWGGPIGAGVASRNPSLVSSVVFANTVVGPPRHYRGALFHKFSHFPIISDIAFRLFGFPIPIMHWVQGDNTSIGWKERQAYNYCYKSWRERGTPLALTRMVPNSPTHPSIPIMQKTLEWAQEFKGASGLVWGTKDPILGRTLKRLTDVFPNAIVVETKAGHFLQEEVPEQLSAVIAKVIES